MLKDAIKMNIFTDLNIEDISDKMKQNTWKNSLKYIHELRCGYLEEIHCKHYADFHLL